MKKEIFTIIFGMSALGGQIEGSTNFNGMYLPTVIPTGNTIFGSINGVEVSAAEIIRWLDNMVWGPWLLILLLGTGCYLMVRLKFLPLKNLKYAMKCAFGIGVKNESGGTGGGTISSFASLTTELAITLGIGNIIGVATAMVLGGPGALFWLIVTRFSGLATMVV